MNLSPFDKQTIRNDLVAGFAVFLIALPLSLGIAMASGVPPFAGLVAAVLGGLLMPFFGGGRVSINGPAAGLIVVVLHGVELLGAGDPLLGYRRMLAVTVIAGAALVALGLGLRAGRFGVMFPAAAVQGLLAAIGLIIISKQAHVFLGVTPQATNPLGLMAEIPKSLGVLNPEVALIGLISMGILIGLPRVPVTWINRVPAPMVVVLVGLLLSRIFDLEHEHSYLFLDHHSYNLGPKFLVSLPENILAGFVTPDFSVVAQPGFVGVLLTLTVVQGLETMLSAAAVDQFDPLRRRTDLSRDVAAVGLVSAISGAVGGLPIIAEIVRSRANVSQGARSPTSNFVHGALVLMFVALAPGMIHQIPLASLAALLMCTGYRLASPDQVVTLWRVGREQLLIFLVTIVMTLATDLLIGVGSGIALKLALHVLRGTRLRHFLAPQVELEERAGGLTLRVKGHVVFSALLALDAELDQVPEGRALHIDLTEVTFMDLTSRERLSAFVSEYTSAGGMVTVSGDWSASLVSTRVAH